MKVDNVLDCNENRYVGIPTDNLIYLLLANNNGYNSIRTYMAIVVVNRYYKCSSGLASSIGTDK